MFEVLPAILIFLLLIVIDDDVRENIKDSFDWHNKRGVNK